ncbi:hypothetical protein PIB30_081558 [Stylosanthes scabra]|uniref:Uncharacterized protein n=1 Tax=Stylosanthes scabra TaxID=79078 RepID=A0ABU6ZQE4_9FABA|nr:hypothetical protein [Stylosanthes scabra]
MSSIFRTLSRRLSIRSSSTSSPSSSSNPLTERVNQSDELSPKHNIFEEEVCFEDINQAIDNWEIPKIPQDELYVPDDNNKRKSDYIIKTAENNIPLGPESGEEFHLLTKQSQFSTRIPRSVNSGINISGLQNNSNIAQPIYQTDDDVDLQSIQSPTYSSLNDDIHG